MCWSVIWDLMTWTFRSHNPRPSSSLFGFWLTCHALRVCVLYKWFRCINSCESIVEHCQQQRYTLFTAKETWTPSNCKRYRSSSAPAIAGADEDLYLLLKPRRVQVSWKYWYLSHSIYHDFKNTFTAIDSVCVGGVGGGGESLNKLNLTKPLERTVLLARGQQHYTVYMNCSSTTRA